MFVVLIDFVQERTVAIRSSSLWNLSASSAARAPRRRRHVAELIRLPLGSLARTCRRFAWCCATAASVVAECSLGASSLASGSRRAARPPPHGPQHLRCAPRSCTSISRSRSRQATGVMFVLRQLLRPLRRVRARERGGERGCTARGDLACTARRHSRIFPRAAAAATTRRQLEHWRWPQRLLSFAIPGGSSLPITLSGALAQG